jgi:hypothetical protein
MLRYLWLLLLPAVLLIGPPPAQAQWPQPGPPAPGWRDRPADGLAGQYLSQGGAPCSVERRRDSYTFTNEQGSWARFVFAGRNRLEQVAGEWDPAVVCTVTRDRLGRTVLRFDSPNAPSGYWTSAD